MTGITDRFAHFVAAARYEDLSAIATRRMTDAITDALGVGLAGVREPMAAMLAAAIGTTASPADHLLIGSPRRASAVESALYNGAIIHAIDYDDSSHPAYAHPSCHLVPVLLALGRQFGRSGRDLLLAYAVGLELEGKLGRALNTAHYLKGWHTTGTFGAMAAAAAAAKLAGLDAAGAATALALAASAAGGLRANFGTMAKPLHAGYAARTGVLAALLAREGFTAAPDVLENRHGYLAVFSATGNADVSSFAHPGDPWEVDTRYGLAIKPYPSCGSTHTAIEGALRARCDLGTDAIASVRVGTNEMCSQTLVYKDPRTPLEAKYCMEYCIAAALVLGAIGKDSFGAPFLHDHAVRDLMRRITVEVDDRVRHSAEHGTVVTLRTTTGRVIEHAVPLAQGKPERWLDRDALWGKFRDCASAALPMPRVEKAFELLGCLGGLPSIDPLLAAIDVDTAPLSR